MDGLMLDTEPVYKRSWQQACAELGFHLSDQDYEPYIGRPTGDCEPELAAWFGPSFPLEQFRVRWPELWESVIRENGVAQKSGLEALLGFLESQNVPKAVATSTASEDTKFTLRSGGVDPARFSAIVTRDQVPNGKPAPDLYLEAARRLGADPTQCIALEDSDAGTLSAAAAGMRAICVPDLKQPSEAARKAAWRVAPSLNEARTEIASLLRAKEE
jgi:beta-phosphoglucomutase-like phosphatase (HAD superfamily)